MVFPTPLLPDANAITAQYFQVKPLSSVRPKGMGEPEPQHALRRPPRVQGHLRTPLALHPLGSGATEPRGTNSPFVPSAPSLDALADPGFLLS